MISALGNRTLAAGKPRHRSDIPRRLCVVSFPFQRRINARCSSAVSRQREIGRGSCGHLMSSPLRIRPGPGQEVPQQTDSTRCWQCPCRLVTRLVWS